MVLTSKDGTVLSNIPPIFRTLAKNDVFSKYGESGMLMNENIAQITDTKHKKCCMPASKKKRSVCQMGTISIR
jgi:hypothetical protein